MHQMPFVNIVGIGTGVKEMLTKEAEEVIARSACLIGDQRVLKPFEYLGLPLFYSSNTAEIASYIAIFTEQQEVAILVSGDIGFYSLAKVWVERSEQKEKIRLICGISSLQYFCAKLQIPWQAVATVSLHGREAKVVNSVMNNSLVFILTGGAKTPREICEELCQAGLDEVEVSVGEDLSYPSERITTKLAKELVDMTFSSLAVMLVKNEKIIKKTFASHGLPDDYFIRGKAPMTKQEVRAIVLAKLQLSATDTVYDIGAGTGSVAIEMALQVTEGSVYAFEKESEAIDLLKINQQRFGTYHLQVRQTVAPKGMADLPRPDKAFIGGSGGNLAEILDCLYLKNPQVRVVITAITLETLQKAVQYYQDKPYLETEVIQVTLSKAKKLGMYHMMTAQNPVFVITAEASSEGSELIIK